MRVLNEQIRLHFEQKVVFTRKANDSQKAKSTNCRYSSEFCGERFYDVTTACTCFTPVNSDVANAEKIMSSRSLSHMYPSLFPCGSGGSSANVSSVGWWSPPKEDSRAVKL